VARLTPHRVIVFVCLMIFFVGGTRRAAIGFLPFLLFKNLLPNCVMCGKIP
jgi:hypothetical protein